MSVWTTKSLDRHREYIVLRHTLRGVNHIVSGVRFRNSYAVVEKDSKTHKALKKIPVLRRAQEYPLTHLRALKFITRTADIRTVFGQDVYHKFLLAESKQLEVSDLLATQEVERKEAEEQAMREADLAKKKELEDQLKKLEEDKLAAEALVKSEEVIKVEEDLVKEVVSQIPEISKCAYRTPTGKLCKHDALDYSPSDYCAMHLLQDEKLEELGIEVPKFLEKKKKKAFKSKTIETLKKMKKSGQF